MSDGGDGKGCGSYIYNRQSLLCPLSLLSVKAKIFVTSGRALSQHSVHVDNVLTVTKNISLGCSTSNFKHSMKKKFHPSKGIQNCFDIYIS